MDIETFVIKGDNIVITGTLFKNFDKKTISLFKNKNYILIIDGLIPVAEVIPTTSHDIKLIANKTKLNENNTLEWIDNKYTGKFDKYKDLCNSNSLYCYKNTVLIYLFPIQYFKNFSSIYLLTYMFEAQIQKCYYDFYGVKYKYLGIVKDSDGCFNFTEPLTKRDSTKYKDLIHIEDNLKMNTVGDNYNNLSESWYNRNINDY